MSVEVIKPGMLTTLQDGGRRGHAHLGIGRSGAFDAPALRIANALCGNPRDACALEITLLGPTLQFHAPACIAVTGAPIPLRIDGREMPRWAPVQLPAGARLSLGAMPRGCRSYLAVQGGFDVAPVLGSRSTDLNAAVGPFDGRPLRAGDRLALAANDASVATCATPGWWLDARPWFADDAAQPLHLLPARHQVDLTDASRRALSEAVFTVQADSNRTGLRLQGPPLAWQAPLEMVSEGCVPGLLQLPPSGQPIVFGVECPVSGGYPRIGQVAAIDLPRLAQARPGAVLRFEACTLAAAWQALQKRERALADLETRIATRLSA